MSDIFELPETHHEFKLNKLHFNNEELADVAYSLIKEGEEYEGHIGNFLLDWLNDKSYVEVKTSGSTGTPKKIQLEKKAMLNSALATGNFFELPAGTRALHCLPTNFIAGKMMLLRAMLLGWQIDMIKPTANPLDQCFKIYDFCAMTPFQLDKSLNSLHLIKKLIVGGGAVSTHLCKLIQNIDTKVYETYGMTETITHIAARHINPKKETERPIPFRVLPGISISTDDRNCLVIDAPRILEKPFVTNDVVVILEDDKFLWKGRYDNVINSGGIKLYPEEIEAKLDAIIAHRFFVAAVPDDALGEKLVLFVEIDNSEAAIENLEKEVREFRILEKYEIPKKIYLVEKFKETPNGKINRGETIKSRRE